MYYNKKADSCNAVFFGVCMITVFSNKQINLQEEYI